MHKLIMQSDLVRDFEIPAQLKERAQSLKDPLLRDVLLEDPAIVAKQQIAMGNLVPIGYQSAGGYAGAASKVEAIGIDCPVDINLPVYYAEDNSCLRLGVDGVIPERYSLYNQTLVESADYTGACKKSLK